MSTLHCTIGIAVLRLKMNAVSILCLSLLLSFAAAGKPPPKPPPPSLNDTFIGSGTVRIDLGERNITGTCNYTIVLG